MEKSLHDPQKSWSNFWKSFYLLSFIERITGTISQSEVIMSKRTNDKGTSDIEREFEEEMKKESPEKIRLPEEIDLEKEYGEEAPQEKELDLYAKKFYDLSGRSFKTEADLESAVNGVLNEIEKDHFFRGLPQKTKKAGKLLLEKGLRTFKGVSAFQAVVGITQLARENLKGTLGTLAKMGLKGGRAGAAVLPVLGALGFQAGEQNRDAWQNFASVCEESFDYLAVNLNEKADDPLEASKLASEAFNAALRKVKSESRATPKRKIGMAEKPGRRNMVGRRVVIALFLVCIVLSAGLVAEFAVYAPTINNLEAQIAEQNNTISTLNRTVTVLQNTLDQIALNQSATNQTDINLLNAEIQRLNQQIVGYNNVLSLNASGVLYNQGLTEQENSFTAIWNDVLNYAGYVNVEVQSSDSATTYVQVIWQSTFGVDYNSTIIVGTSGTAAFPVLPSVVEIRIGNTEPVNPVSATVKATYYY